MKEHLAHSEEREKKARAAKDQLLALMNSMDSEDNTKRNNDINTIKQYYEQLQIDLKTQFEDDLNRYKDQIADLEGQLRRKQLINSQPPTLLEDHSKIVDLKQQINNLELKNQKLSLELDKKNSGEAFISSLSASMDDSCPERQMRSINRLKEEHKEAIRALQREHNQSITVIISEYEKKVLDLKTQLKNALDGIPPTSECPTCRLRSSKQGLQTAGCSPVKIEKSQAETFGKASKDFKEDVSDLHALRGEIKDLRVSLRNCEQKLSESVIANKETDQALLRRMNASKSGFLDNSHYYNQGGFQNRQAYSFRSNAGLNEPWAEQENADMILPPRALITEDSGADQELVQVHTYTITKPISKPSEIMSSINRTPMREKPIFSNKVERETLNKSGVRIIDSDMKDYDKNSLVLQSMRGMPVMKTTSSQAQPMSVKRFDHGRHPDPYDDMDTYSSNRKVQRQTSRSRSQQRRDKEPAHLVRRSSRPDLSDALHRASSSRHTDFEDDASSDLHSQVISLLERVGKSQAEHSRALAQDDSTWHRSNSRTPTRAREKSSSQRGASDKGFLNFYRENWHSSTFTLEHE